MSSIAQPFDLKLPARNSLAGIGIPDDFDALAIFFHWRRQAYFRAHSEQGPELAASLLQSPTLASGPTPPPSDESISPSAVVNMPVGLATLSVDLLRVGAQFEDEGLIYAAEIDDILG